MAAKKKKATGRKNKTSLKGTNKNTAKLLKQLEREDRTRNRRGRKK